MNNASVGNCIGQLHPACFGAAWSSAQRIDLFIKLNIQVRRGRSRFQDNLADTPASTRKTHVTGINSLICSPRSKSLMIPIRQLVHSYRQLPRDIPAAPTHLQLTGSSTATYMRTVYRLSRIRNSVTASVLFAIFIRRRL